MASAQASSGLEQGREALRYCNSFNRLPALVDLWKSGTITTDAWLTLLGEEWSASDNIAQHRRVLLTKTPLLHALHTPGLRRFLMTAEELDAFNALPREVTLFRGCYAHNRRGLSWSLNRDVAAAFPMLHRYRHDGEPLLLEASAKKADILALKLCRDEAEVIAHQPKVVLTSKIPQSEQG